MTTKTLSQHKTETVAAAREQGYAGTDAEYEMTADDMAFIARAMVGDVESVVGHDGSGDLRVIVEQAIRDGVETVEEMADIVREARAVGDTHDAQSMAFIQGIVSWLEGVWNGVGRRRYTGAVKKLVDAQGGEAGARGAGQVLPTSRRWRAFR